MPINYIPPSLANEITKLPTLNIYAVALPPPPVPKPSAGSPAIPKINHWVLHLAISQTKSIQLDPSPDGDNNLILIVRQKEYLYSKHAVKIMQLNIIANLTVGEAVKHLQTSNSLQYEFSTGGHGCRYWVHSIISRLQSVGYIVDDSQLKETKDALGVVWDEAGKVADQDQSGIIAGTFS